MKKFDFSDFSIVENKSLKRRNHTKKLAEDQVEKILRAKKPEFNDWTANNSIFSTTVAIENENYSIELHKDPHQGSFSIETKGKNALGIDLKLMSKPEDDKDPHTLTSSELQKLNARNQELPKFLQEVLEAIQQYIVSA
jgi:hypothetical protein